MQVRRVEQSAWTRRDHFVRMAYLKYRPAYLAPQFLACQLGCALGNPDTVSAGKCLLYLRSGSPSCVECYALLMIALPYLNPSRHGVTWRRLPLLRILRPDATIPRVSDIELDRPREELLDMSAREECGKEQERIKLRGRKPQQPIEWRELQPENQPVVTAPERPRIIETATPKVEVVLEAPEPPKSYKYLWIGTCGECGNRRQKIVAFDMCWKCHWLWRAAKK